MAIQYGGPSIGAAHIPFTPPASVARPRPRVVPTLVPPVRHPSLTAPQVANQQVNQALAPQITAQNAFNQRQNQAITAFANALLGKLTPLAGQVGQTYDQAIGQTQALSNQSAQFLQNANPSPQVQALLQSAGAPQAQQDQLTQALGGTFGGGAGVLSFLGGAVPGGQLAADKAAVVGQTAQLPGIAALQGEQSLASALGTQADARNQLLATRPGLYQTALQNIRQNQGARAKLNQDARQNQFEDNLAASKVNIGVQEFNAGQRAKAAGVRAATASAAAKLAEAQREFRVKRSDAATAAVTKATQANAAAQVKAKQAFFTWFTGTKQTYDDKTITEIAKDVFGIDVSGLSTTAPPPKPHATRSVSGVVGGEKGTWQVDEVSGKRLPGSFVPNGSATPPPKSTRTVPGVVGGEKGTWQVDSAGKKLPGSFIPSGQAASPKIIGDDKTGRYTVNSDGTYSQLPGPLGKPVATKGGASSASTDRLIANQLLKMHRGTAIRYQHVGVGQPGADEQGFVQVPGTGSEGSYQDALSYAAVAYGGDKAKALKAVNQIYAMGDGGRPYEGPAAMKAALEGANAAYAAGVPYQQALQTAQATGKYPPKVLVAAMRKVYYIDHARSPVNGVPPSS